MEERKHLSGVDRNQEQGAKNRLLYPETRGFGQPTGVHRLVSSSLSLAEVLQQLYFIRKKNVLAPAHWCVSSLWCRWEAEATLMLCLTNTLQFYNHSGSKPRQETFCKKEIPSYLDISRGENVWKGEIPLFRRIPHPPLFSLPCASLVPVCAQPEGLGALPRERGLANKPCSLRTQRLFVHRAGKEQLGVEDALGRAARCRAGPPWRPAQHRAAASAGHRTERKKNNQFFRGESPRKCAKRDTGTVWKSRAMFH